MVIECSNCHARYNVDENKIPSSGVKVKCHKCQHIIVIRKEVPPPQPAPEPVLPEEPHPPEVPPAVTPPETPSPIPEAPSTPEPEIPEPEAPSTIPSEQPEEPKKPFPSAPSEEEVGGTSGAPGVEPPTPEPPEPAPPEMPDTTVPSASIEPPIQAPAPEVQAPAEPAAPAAMSEEDKKWNERARRLAKALASDLVLYNQDKVEEGLRNGTLAGLLGSEIRRSWEYYCQQIPKHIIESTDHFKDQLNKIVGKGKEIFK